MKTVFIEMEKLKNPNSGLGQFCLKLGENMAAILTPELSVDLYTPRAALNQFGSQFNYILHKDIHKLTTASRKPYHVWHCTHQGSPYLPFSKQTKLILTIHDLNFIEKYKGIKQAFKLRQLQKKVNRADVLTFISNYTLQDAQKHLNLGSKQTAVIYNGNSLQLFPQATKPAYAPGTKFLFSIGILSPKKNFHVLLPFVKSLNDHTLIIAGNNTSTYAKLLLQQAKELGISDRLILPGIVSEQEKYWLYKNAEAFVFPSLTEGFGLPVIEAMSLGKPVFLSSLSSLPEIGGKQAYYWADFNAENMHTVFLNGMKDYSSNVLKREAIKSWADQFSWKKAARQYLELYQY